MSSRPEITAAEAQLAAELALNLLAGEEREAAELKLLTESAFRDEVEAWQEGLIATLGAGFAETPPRRGLKAEVMSGIFAPAPRKRRRWPRRLAFTVIGAGAITAGVVFGMPYLGLEQPQWAPPEVFPGAAEPPLPSAAHLSLPGSGEEFLAILDNAQGVLHLARIAGATDEAGLWAQGTAAPVLVGIIEGPGAWSFDWPAEVDPAIVTLGVYPGPIDSTGPGGDVLAQGVITEFQN